MIQVKQCRHGRMMFYDNDRYIGHSLDVSGVYSEGEVLLWRQLVRPGWQVIEVGANIGAHTVWLSRTVGPAGTVLAIEPQRQVYHMLCGNLALNGISNVLPMLAAAGDELGSIIVPKLDYNKHENFGGLSLVAEEGDVVPLVTIDSFPNSSPDFIKIDVEGMEADVVRGARHTIERCHPVLYVENDREEKAVELATLIRDLGYRLYWHSPFINRDLFGTTVSLNMLCVQSGASVAGLEEVVAEDCAKYVHQWMNGRGG